ncbi:MAG: PaaI family thioesterase [Spirochaetes bacterium]|nr:PaaI family thioesterase [Spirochaetota bacterium]
MIKYILDDHCFACGKDNKIGLKLQFSEDKINKKVWTKLQLPREYQGVKGFAHGGIIATLLDEASAYASLAAGYSSVTAELNIKYRHPVPINQPIEVSADFIEKNNRIIIIKAKIIHDHKIVAKADAKMYDISDRLG